jgi:hypothetical protein
LRIISMFSSTYLCESTFSNMSFIRSRHRSSVTDDSLLNLFKTCYNGNSSGRSNFGGRQYSH